MCEEDRWEKLSRLVERYATIEEKRARLVELQETVGLLLSDVFSSNTTLVSAKERLEALSSLVEWRGTVSTLHEQLAILTGVFGSDTTLASAKERLEKLSSLVEWRGTISTIQEQLVELIDVFGSDATLATAMGKLTLLGTPFAE